MHMRYVLFGALLLAIALVSGLLFFYQTVTHSPALFNGTYLDPPALIEPFELASTDGQVDIRGFQGEYAILVFGYTYCPDVCPTTLAQMARVMQRVSDDVRDETNVVLISVDPDRDTAERVGRYARSFNSAFIGLTGTEAQLDTVSARFGVFREKVQKTAESEYLVDHTSSVIVLDKQGAMRLVWSFGLTTEEMAADMERLANIDG